MKRPRSSCIRKVSKTRFERALHTLPISNPSKCWSGSPLRLIRQSTILKRPPKRKQLRDPNPKTPPPLRHLHLVPRNNATTPPPPPPLADLATPRLLKGLRILVLVYLKRRK